MSASPPGRIVVDRVSRSFRVYPKAQRTLKDVFVSRGRLVAREVQALRDVSLSVEPGGAVGLVGRNGSGKTTLLKIVSGIIKPTSGRVEATGRIASLLELGAGFHPDFTGRENVYLNGSIHGLSRARVREVMDEIVAFAELEQFIDLPVRTYSSGMYMRLGFSVAAHIQSDVLLLDEVFAVGDEQFQRKCFGKIAEFKNRGGTILFVSHDAQAVERLCDRAMLLRQGEVAFDGPTREAIADYRRLLAADANPEELEAGLREWGSGEARIVSAQLLDDDGDERSQFASGEPVDRPAGRRGGGCRRGAARLAGAARRGRPRPRHRGPGDVACSGGTARAGERELRFRPRTAAARRRALPSAPRAPRCRRTTRCTSSTTRCASSSSRRATRRARSCSTERGRCRRSRRASQFRGRELRVLSRLARPDGGRAGAAVHALHTRRGAAAAGRLRADHGISLDSVAVCCDLDSHIFNPAHTDPQIVEALRGTHWIDALRSQRLAAAAQRLGGQGEPPR